MAALLGTFNAAGNVRPFLLFPPLCARTRLGIRCMWWCADDSTDLQNFTGVRRNDIPRPEREEIRQQFFKQQKATQEE